MNCFGRSVIDFDTPMDSGMRMPVRTTMKSEIPSMPSRHPNPNVSDST